MTEDEEAVYEAPDGDAWSALDDSDARGRDLKDWVEADIDILGAIGLAGVAVNDDVTRVVLAENGVERDVLGSDGIIAMDDMGAETGRLGATNGFLAGKLGLDDTEEAGLGAGLDDENAAELERILFVEEIEGAFKAEKGRFTAYKYILSINIKAKKPMKNNPNHQTYTRRARRYSLLQRTVFSISIFIHKNYHVWY